MKKFVLCAAAAMSATVDAQPERTVAPAPALSPAAGTYTTAQTVTITDSTSGAAIYYTTDGSTPTTGSNKYTAAIKVSATETVKAIAAVNGDANSPVASASYVIETPTAAPVFLPPAGTYAVAQSVSLSDATTGASIYYTTNGATPTTLSTEYSGAIKVGSTETLKAIAVANAHTTSTVASAAYTIETATATPVFSPAAGTYAGAQTISVTDATAGATIYYTTDGSTPTSASKKYTAAFALSASGILKAIAIAPEHTQSAVASGTYTITPPAPTLAWVPFVLTPTAGAFGGKNGLIVMPANNLAASPAPTYITTQPVQPLGFAEQFAAGGYRGTLLAGNLVAATDPTIQLMFYAAMGADGKVHVYGLNLSQAGTTPVPAQVSNLSLTALAAICGGQVIQTSLNTATAAGLLIKIAGPEGCAGGYGYEYLKYGDSATTTPLAVSLPPDTFVTPLYAYGGALTGVLTETFTDSTASTANVSFYAGDTFTSPELILSNTPFFAASTAVVSNGATASPAYVNIVVTGSSANNASTLYAVSAQGAVSKLASIPGLTEPFSTYSVTFDDDNLYVTTASGATTSVYQLSLSLAGTPQLLYGGTGLPAANLLGANDSELVIQSGEAGSVYSLPVGKTSRAPTMIAGPFGQSPAAGVCVVAASPASAAGAQVFINELTGNYGLGIYTDSSLVMTPSGTVTQPLAANTTYEAAGSGYTGVPPTFGLHSGVMIQVSGITDTGVGQGGGHFNTVNVSTMASTPLVLPGGAVYTIPTGQGFVAPFYAITSTIAAGSLETSVEPDSEIGLLADLSRHLIVPISIANTDVSFP
jgi:hypothetical protein